MLRLLRDERGASPVEFVLVGALLTTLTLIVLQVGVALYVRNMVLDAAVEGAHRAALADASLSDGIESTARQIIRTVGGTYAQDISAVTTQRLGVETVEVTVRAPIPVIWLLGVGEAMEVTGYAPRESFDIP